MPASAVTGEWPTHERVHLSSTCHSHSLRTAFISTPYGECRWR
jgi:hypothetical protein